MKTGKMEENRCFMSRHTGARSHGCCTKMWALALHKKDFVFLQE